MDGIKRKLYGLSLRHSAGFGHIGPARHSTKPLRLFLLSDSQCVRIYELRILFGLLDRLVACGGRSLKAIVDSTNVCFGAY